MGRDPDNGNCERDHEDKENQSPFASLLAKRTRAATAWSAGFAKTFVVQRNRNIEAFATLVGSPEQFFAFAPGTFFRDARRLFDHPLEVLHFTPEFFLPPGELLLLLVKRCAG
jgi:hypothetical protein